MTIATVAACPPAQAQSSRIEAAHIDTERGGILWVSIGSAEERVASGAFRFWTLDGGTRLVFSAADGAGGFENEGQSLWLFEPGAPVRKLLSELYVIEQVIEVSSRARRGLLVSMRDGGLGASHFGVVDLARGQVLSVPKAKLLRRATDSFTIGFFGDDDWERLDDGKAITPQSTRTYKLEQVLGRPVIRPRAKNGGR